MRKYPIILLAVFAGLAVAAPEPMDRAVSGHAIISAHDPKVQIELPLSAVYVGSSHWVMQRYFDDVELHAFVEADAAKRVQRLYWVQFEAYLPSHPEYHHTYDSKRHVTIGGLDFLVDTWVETTVPTDEPDSDSAMLQALVAGKGYRFPPSMMSVRFV